MKSTTRMFILTSAFAILSSPIFALMDDDEGLGGGTTESTLNIFINYDKVQIIDADGNVAAEITKLENNVFSALPNGTYTVKCFDKEGNIVESYLFVK